VIFSPEFSDLGAGEQLNVLGLHYPFEEVAGHALA
jgi:hypothetical protein